MFKNVAGQFVAAQMVNLTTGADVTTGTTTVYVTGDAGTQASGGTATHEGNGCWSFAPSQANTNYTHVSFTFVNTAAVSVTVQTWPLVLNDFADALLKRDMSAVSGESARSPLNALRFLRNKWALSGATLSVKKEDDSTEAWTGTVTSSATANPITGVGPG